MSRSSYQQLLDKALSGEVESLGDLLETYRAYLTVLAKRYLSERIKGRVDENDIVQVTFLEAQRDFKHFRGSQIEELLGWLRHILRNNISSAHQRHLHTQKRSAGRETSESPGNSGLALVDLAVSETSSPSQRAMRDEAAVFLADCLTNLPESQQEALRLRYVEGLSLREISHRMKKPKWPQRDYLKEVFKHSDNAW